MTIARPESIDQQRRAKEKKDKREKGKKGTWDDAEWGDAWQSSKDDLADFWSDVKLPEAETLNNDKMEVDEEAEEVSFWDELDSMAAGPRHARSLAGSREAKGQGTASVLQVPANRSAELLRRQEQIALVSGAELELSGTVLRIIGPVSARSCADRYARALITERSDTEEHPDLTYLPLLAEWAERWRGNEARFQGSAGALLLIEGPGAQLASRYTPGQAIEARWGPPAPGSPGTWYMAVVLGRPGPGKVRLRWCCDGSTDEVDVSRTRPSWRAAIFGPKAARLATEVSIMVSFEEFAKGSMAARAEAAHPCNGVGMAFTELNVPPRMVYRVLNRLRSHSANTRAQCASGCLKVEFFQYPKWSVTTDNENVICVLTVGTREQRWKASEAIVAYAAVLQEQAIAFIPPHLAGDCRSINVPIGMMGSFIGARQSNISKLMEDTQTFLFTLRERKGQQAKQDLDDSADMVEVMLDQLRKGPAAEVVIFGSPRSQFSAEIKIMAQIEERYTGYCQNVSTAESEVEGLGIDMVRLSGDFEETASRTQAEILTGASMCLVESAGRLVFFAGTKDQRVRAKEYLKYMTSRRLGTKLVVPDPEFRSDAMQLRVPKEVMKSSWLIEQLDELSMQSKTAAFFDTWKDPTGWGRVVILGDNLAQSTESDCDIFEKAKALVETTLTWTKRGSSSAAGLRGEWWKVDGDTCGRGSRRPPIQGTDAEQTGEGAEDSKEGDSALAGQTSDLAEGDYQEAPGDGEEEVAYSSDVLAAAPSTPPLGISIGKVGLAVPSTPAPGAPCTPAPGAAAAPMSPVANSKRPLAATTQSANSDQSRFRGAPPPKYAMVGFSASEEPQVKRFRGAPPPKAAVVQTASRKRVASPKTPAAPRPNLESTSAVSQPCTPAVGVAAPHTPAVGVAAPHTPAVSVPAPRTPALGTRPPAAARIDAVDVAMPSTPAVGNAQTPRMPAVGTAPPATARVEPAEDVPLPIPPAAGARPTLAGLLEEAPSSMFDADLAPPMDLRPSPVTPAILARGPSAPQTPAAIANRGTDAAPKTPAFITGSKGGAAPQTPAFISASRGFAPQTPAFTAGKAGAPQTPGGRAGAPQTPGSKARGAPGTPAAISSATRPVPQTPAAMGGTASGGKPARLAPSTPAVILASGPPSPTSAPPSRAPMQMQQPPQQQASRAQATGQVSRFAPKKSQGAPAEDGNAPDESTEETGPADVHHGMTYSEWVAARAASSDA